MQYMNTRGSRHSLIINTNSLFHNFGNVWKMHFYAVLIFIHGHGHPLKLPCCLQVGSYCGNKQQTQIGLCINLFKITLCLQNMGFSTVQTSYRLCCRVHYDIEN